MSDSELAEQTVMMDMKAELLSSLKIEIAGLFKSELKNALAFEFDVIKTELQAVKVEIANNTATLRSDLETVKMTMSEMEHSLSVCLDDVTSLQKTHT